jgi:hypothetical protein
MPILDKDDLNHCKTALKCYLNQDVDDVNLDLISVITTDGEPRVSNYNDQRIKVVHANLFRPTRISLFVEGAKHSCSDWVIYWDPMGSSSKGRAIEQFSAVLNSPNNVVRASYYQEQAVIDIARRSAVVYRQSGVSLLPHDMIVRTLIAKKSDIVNSASGYPTELVSFLSKGGGLVANGPSSLGYIRLVEKCHGSQDDYSILTNQLRSKRVDGRIISVENFRDSIHTMEFNIDEHNLGDTIEEVSLWARDWSTLVKVAKLDFVTQSLTSYLKVYAGTST